MSWRDDEPELSAAGQQGGPVVVVNDKCDEAVGAELIVRRTEAAVDGDVDVLAALDVQQPRTVDAADRRLGGTERRQIAGHRAKRNAAEHGARVLVGHLHCQRHMHNSIVSAPGFTNDTNVEPGLTLMSMSMSLLIAAL